MRLRYDARRRGPPSARGHPGQHRGAHARGGQGDAAGARQAPRAGRAAAAVRPRSAHVKAAAARPAAPLLRRLGSPALEERLYSYRAARGLRARLRRGRLRERRGARVSEAAARRRRPGAVAAATASTPLLLLAFAAMSVCILAALATRPLTMTGAESGVVADQLQYFAWIREAGENVVIRNVWDIDPDGTSYFVHPGFLRRRPASTSSGLSIPLAYQILWKPVAVARRLLRLPRLRRAGCCRERGAAGGRAGDRAVLRVPAGGGRCDLLADRRPRLPQGAQVPRRRGVPGRLRLGLPDDGHRGRPASRSCCSRPSARGSRAAAARARPRPGTWAWRRRGALIVSWLQPWQGVALIATVAVVELLRAARPARAPGRCAARSPGPLLVGRRAAAPLLLDARAGGPRLGDRRPREPQVRARLAAVGLGARPAPARAAGRAGLPAAGRWLAGAGGARAAVRDGRRVLPDQRRAASARSRSTRSRGCRCRWRSWRWPARPSLRPADWWAPARAGWRPRSSLLLALGVADRLNQIRIEIHKGGQPYLHPPRRAGAPSTTSSDLDRRGGVLAPIYAGLMVPYQTGRETWVGQISWTPNYRRRVDRAEELFSGELDREHAVRLVSRSGARFLFADCLDARRPEPRAASLPDVGPALRLRDASTRSTAERCRDGREPVARGSGSRCCSWRGRHLGGDHVEGHAAQRRGADAAGRRPDRRRRAALPRLLVVLPARASRTCSPGSRDLRAVAARVADRPGAHRTRRWRCSSTCSRAARRRAASRCSLGRWPPSRWRLPPARTRIRWRWRSRSAASSRSTARRLVAGALVGVVRRSGGSSSPPTSGSGVVLGYLVRPGPGGRRDALRFAGASLAHRGS